jgi:hypothetical protein
VLRVTKKVALYLIVVLAAGLALDAIQQLYWSSRPASAFKSLVGKLPEQITVRGYGTCITDKLLHRAYYWRIRGEPASLRELAHRLGYVRSDEGAARMLPQSKKCIAPLVSKDDVVEGYEQKTSRNHWYYLLKGEREALLAF